MIKIDGAFGEGGGQILRTSLSLSVIFQKALHIYNIRANRKNPGLQPQHLTCVKACAEISKAELKGAALHSKEIYFKPKKLPENKNYFFDIKTAGSTLLLFQTLLYPLALNNGGILKLKGGTHVPFSPCFHYIKFTFLPVIQNFGLNFSITMEKAGFYPAGGGIVRAEVNQWRSFCSVEFSEGFFPEEILIFSVISSKLPEHILIRQADSAFALLKKHLFFNKIYVEIKKEVVESPSPGTVVFICARDKNKFAGFTQLGKKGYPAEKVGEDCALKFLEFLNSGAQFEEHLADQLLIPLTFAIIKGEKKEFSYSVSKVSKHLISQARVIQKFLPQIKIKIKGKEGEKGKVLIKEGRI
jgi:RNA 3'-phosphate cyclase